MKPVWKVRYQKSTYLAGIIGLVFGCLFTWLYFRETQGLMINNPLRELVAGKPLIRPLLAYSTPESTLYGKLKGSIKNIIDVKLGNQEIAAVSVYYRNLTTGQWFGLNQDETFVPASLFKVPLMITYLKDAESNPYLLSKKITDDLTQDNNQNETIKPLKSIIKGNSYTVEELLSYMIEYSDNNATNLLFEDINKDTLKQVFEDLDIQVPNGTAMGDFVSVNNYSFLFRVLYNATYLNRDMSEKALELLSKVDFKEGIRNAAPDTVAIANKFGEYYLLEDGVIKERQLHDCGIVYHPAHPYILCIMTKGNSLDALKQTIQQISKTVYDNATVGH